MIHYEFVMGTSTPDATNTKWQTLLPGCGRPLNYIPQQSDPDYIGELFKNALSGLDIEEHEIAYVFLHFIRYDFEQKGFWFRMPMTTLREFAMLQFMNSVTDKLDWHIKVGCSSRSLPNVQNRLIDQ